MKKSSLLFPFIVLWSVTAFAQQVQLNAKKLEPKVDELVKQYQALDIFSGVVLLAQKGKPIYHKAFGLANREKQIPNTKDTKFDIGSMNKTFTKVVIHQLVEEGTLNLDDPIGKYLKGFPEAAAKKATIKNLLNHTAGFGDYFTPDYFQAPAKEKTIASLTERIRKMPLLYEPGTDQQYSNAGYILLGAIIEKVSGDSYHQNVQDRIVEPLGLSETYVFDKQNVPNKAIGYYKNRKGELQSNEGMLELPNPDGGFLSTTVDILTFYREFFYGNKLMSPEARVGDELLTFIEQLKPTGKAFPFAGGFEGANTAYYEVLRDQISIIVFANMDEPVAENLADGILSIIRGEEPEAPSLPAIQQVYTALQEQGADYVAQNFESLITNFHPTDPKDLILNQIGYELLFEGEPERAIQAFELNTRLFPDVPNVWDSLGEAWRKKGDKQKALKYYKKALELDPELPTALQAVEELE